MKCGVITKRISETVATRARDLKLEYVYQGCAFKMQAIREIVTKEGVTLGEFATSVTTSSTCPPCARWASRLPWPTRASA